MAQPIKIASKQTKNKAQIPQSLPANFYRGYVPPKTPQIMPVVMPANQIIDDLDLPPPSKENVVGINLQTGSYSLNNNKHPMSMPVNSGLMMGGGATKNRMALYKNNNKAIPEIKEDDATQDITSGVSKIQMQVGSYTAFQIMGGDNQSMSSFADQDDMGDSDLNQTINDNNNNNNSDKNNNNNNNNNTNNNNKGDSGKNGNTNNNDIDDPQFDMDDDDDGAFDMDED